MSSTVRTIGERGIIDRVRRRVGRGTSSVLVGIGDDAAVLRSPARGAGGRGERLLFASDMLVEGIHFRRRLVPAEWIGWKALACNVSDIAAMGGIPRWAVASVGLPRATPVRFVDGLASGLSRCARRFGVSLVGGDTVRAPQVVVDVAILGTVRPQQLTLRSGARVGDQLFVTGRLGGSYASGRHARFTPRLAEAQRLIRRVRVRAMIDLSDGLASDLWQMSRASRVVLRLEAQTVPQKVSDTFPALKGVRHLSSGLWHALMDGEDFELLFAVGPRDAARVPVRLGDVPVTQIGAAARRGVGVELVQPDGRVTPLIPRGFRHF